MMEFCNTVYCTTGDLICQWVLLEIHYAQWPIMSAILHGMSRDQLMARHKASHIQVAYAPSEEMADKALAAKAAMRAEMGISVHLCGDVKSG